MEALTVEKRMDKKGHYTKEAAGTFFSKDNTTDSVAWVLGRASMGRVNHGDVMTSSDSFCCFIVEHFSYNLSQSVSPPNSKMIRFFTKQGDMFAV